MIKCAACDSTRVFPSRLRNSYEHIRAALTGRQPHRCHQCGWRKWRAVVILESDGADTQRDDLRTGHDTAPVKTTDLDELDPIRSRR